MHSAGSPRQLQERSDRLGELQLAHAGQTQARMHGHDGKLVEEKLLEKSAQSVDLHRLKSGPLGGDQQLGAMISEGQVDLVVFLWDPISVQPHDVDVKALLRIAVLYNVPTACNRATADFVISSTLTEKPYTPKDNKERASKTICRETCPYRSLPLL